MTDFSLFNKMVEDLAAGLREAIEATTTDEMARNPKTAFTDLACRLILRVSKTVSIKPVENTITARQAEAAARIFDALTRYLEANPGHSVRISRSGKFQIVIKTENGNAQVFFGDSVQDACAQAAQTIIFNEEAL